MTRRRPENFDAMTCYGFAAGMLLLAVICIGMGRDIAETYREERKNDEQEPRTTKMGRDGTKTDRPPVERRRALPDSPTSQGVPATALHLRPCAGGADRVTRRLFDAIRQVESGGNDRAVGDGGRSVGAYQCGILAWRDGGGKAADWPRLAYDRAVTEAVMLRYWARYRAVTDEARARTWNGGPTGMNKTATQAYWNKVKGAMTLAGNQLTGE